MAFHHAKTTHSFVHETSLTSIGFRGVHPIGWRPSELDHVGHTGLWPSWHKTSHGRWDGTPRDDHVGHPSVSQELLAYTPFQSSDDFDILVFIFLDVFWFVREGGGRSYACTLQSQRALPQENPRAM